MYYYQAIQLITWDGWVQVQSSGDG